MPWLQRRAFKTTDKCTCLYSSRLHACKLLCSRCALSSFCFIAYHLLGLERAGLSNRHCLECNPGSVLGSKYLLDNTPKRHLFPGVKLPRICFCNKFGCCGCITLVTIWVQNIDLLHWLLRAYQFYHLFIFNFCSVLCIITWSIRRVYILGHGP